MVSQNTASRSSEGAGVVAPAGQGLEPLHEKAGQVVDQVQDKAGQLVHGAKQQATSRLAGQKDQAADTLYTVAHVLRQAGQQLREQDQPPIATLADRTAQQAERGSGYLRGRDVPGLLDDTEQLGRTHPVLFASGALALGLLGVRFLKSSRRPQPQQATTAPLQLPPPTPPTAPLTPLPAGGAGATGAVPLPPPDARPLAAPAPVRVSDDAPIPPVLTDDRADRAPLGTGARDTEDALRRAAGQGTPGGRPRDPRGTTPRS